MKEIGEAPVEWEIVRLEDVVEINKESRDPTKETLNDRFLYIDIESIEGGTGVIKAVKELLGKDAPSRARRVVHQNDVIMSMVRPYLKAFALVPREYNNQICSTGFAVLSCKNVIAPRYLLYTLFSKNVIDQCNKMMVGGQYPALNQSQVAKIKLPLPPLPEQRRIAEILGTVDSAIQKVGGAIEKTERLKKGLMQRLLTRGIGHERFKESEVGRVPEEWEVVKLGDAANVERGKFAHRPRNDPKFYGGNIPFIQTGDISEADGIIKKYSQTLNKEGLKISKLFKKGTVVISIAGNIGDVGILDFDACFPDSVVGISVNSNTNDQFLMYLLMKFKYELSSTAPRSTQKNINLEILDSFKLPIPPLFEQRRIAEMLSAVDTKLELESRRKEKLSRVKRGLMDELLTGKKRLKEKNL